MSGHQDMLEKDFTLSVLLLDIVVRVNGRPDVNVALNRPAYQSSTYSNSQITTYAHLANDGNNNTDFDQGSCASSWAQADPWWAVDLGVKLYVHGVKFTNRVVARTYVLILTVLILKPFHQHLLLYNS